MLAGDPGGITGRPLLMFEGFTSGFVDTGDASIFTRHGGAGPPVLLLHGHPRTSATWHRVAPLLVDRGFTVVCPDLRGYGRSRGPAPAADHSAHSKRAVTAQFATAWWHWFFFAQPDIPERVIGADPDAWYHGDPAAMGQENYDEWRAAVRQPEVVRAMLEDYRAGLTIDRRDEEADRAAGARLRCPVLVLWSAHDDLEELHGDPLAIWAGWAPDLAGHRIDSGHHMAEEAPGPLADALAAFLTARAAR